MKALSLTGLVASLGLCVVLSTHGQQENKTAGANLGVQDPLQSAEVEIQTRGPVHDAFAQVSIRRVDAFPVIAKKPPEPIKELPAAMKPEGAAVVWIPGYWAFDEDRKDFLWVTGIWRTQPPGYVWTAGYWRQAEDGWQWVSGYWAARGETEVALYPPPPDPIPEAAPPMPEGGDYSGGASYIPGNWLYQDNDYWWQPGFWAPNRQGWIWSPSQYSWTPGGYNYRNGFWDYDLSSRGMMFPPAYFRGQPWTQPNWSYQPSYGVWTDYLLNSMFARDGTNRFYFGDYFDPRYTQAGYRPWMDYRVGGQFYDPMFSYYRWQQRSNPRWEAELRAMAQARAAGRMQPLPRTLAELQARARTGAKADIRMIATLDQMKEQIGKLETVNKVQLQQMQQMAKDLQELAKKRAKVEATARVKTKTEAGVVKVQLAQPASLTKIAEKAAETVKAPPTPKTPAVKFNVKSKADVDVDGKAKGKADGKGKVDVETKGKGKGAQVEFDSKGKVEIQLPPKSKGQPPPKESGGKPDKSSWLERLDVPRTDRPIVDRARSDPPTLLGVRRS